MLYTERRGEEREKKRKRNERHLEKGDERKRERVSREKCIGKGEIKRREKRIKGEKERERKRKLVAFFIGTWQNHICSRALGQPRCRFFVRCRKHP